MRKLLVFAAVAALFPLAARPDILVLRNGGYHVGRFISGNNSQIVFQDQNGYRNTYSTSDIQSVQFQNNTRSSSNLGSQQYNTDNTNRFGTRNQANVNWSQARTIPAGTNVVVRTDQAIDSNTASEGETFPASVSQDIVDSSGQVVVPRGSRADLVIHQVSSGGTIGSPDLALDLQDVQVGNQRYLVSTAPVTESNQQGLGKNKRTAEMVGGGTLLGTILGAVAGGGKGAAIGAVAGAAAGAGVQVLTKGKEVKVPAETELTFQLTKPVNLVPTRR